MTSITYLQMSRKSGAGAVPNGTHSRTLYVPSCSPSVPPPPGQAFRLPRPFFRSSLSFLSFCSHTKTLSRRQTLSAASDGDGGECDCSHPCVYRLVGRYIFHDTCIAGGRVLSHFGTARATYLQVCATGAPASACAAWGCDAGRAATVRWNWS